MLLIDTVTADDSGRVSVTHNLVGRREKVTLEILIYFLMISLVLTFYVGLPRKEV